MGRETATGRQALSSSARDLLADHQEDLERCKNSRWEKTGNPVDLYSIFVFFVKFTVGEIKTISQKYWGEQS